MLIRLKHFVREFEQSLLYGFLFSLDIKWKLMDNIEKDEIIEESEFENEDKSFEEYVLDLATDIVQFKVNSRVSIFS